jgi:hypothetical protein
VVVVPTLVSDVGTHSFRYEYITFSDSMAQITDSYELTIQIECTVVSLSNPVSAAASTQITIFGAAV